MALIAAHVILAIALFWLVNRIGEHATDFGYASTTLFEEPNDSLAFNFFIRALAPAVFIVAMSAAAVAIGHADLRFGIYWIVIYYFALRAIFIFFMNMQRLVSWPRFVVHSCVGIAAAWLAYQSLIIPNRSLLPNLDTAGNELWLAIGAFLYVVANRVTVSGRRGDRRRNAFIQLSYNRAHTLYGDLVDECTSEEKLQLIVYAILIYEDYCRPSSVRALERLFFWKKKRTTGVMQVTSSVALSDRESVRLGTQKLRESWEIHADEPPSTRCWSTIGDYNKDSIYATKVMDVMEILAKRAAPRFLSAYRAMFQDF